MTKDRMFHMLVVGGVAVVCAATTSMATAACGGATDGGSPIDGGSPAVECGMSSGSGAVTGNVSGVSLNVVSVTSIFTESRSRQGLLAMNDFPVGCEQYYGATHYPDGGTVATLTLFPESGAVGTYRVVSGGLEETNLDTNMRIVNAGAISGKITISSSTACEITGSIDIQFLDGGLRGTFRAPVCPVPVPVGDAGPYFSDSGISTGDQ